jgi:Cu-Zn family superoxide dismutase
MKEKIMALGLGLVLVFMLGCGQSPPETAKCVLINAQGQKVGEAKLTETSKGVEINLTVENLPPGWHAFHIHEKGLCNPPEFMSAGAHFNPYGKHHGLKSPQGPHAGDLPNLVVAENGRGTLNAVAPLVTLKPGQPNSLFQPGGTSLVIHAQKDDDLADPAGNAGARIACGVITK